MISHEYPKILGKKLPFKVINHMEYVYGLIKDEKLKFKKGNPVKVAFKDPCELGRHCGVYDIARNLINSIPGVENKELTNNRENALCCGAGGLVKINHPDMAENIAKMLIEQMEEKEIELCLNACPSMRISPLSGSTKPTMMLNSVDLPQPLGPTMLTNWPGSTVKLISSSVGITRSFS